MKRLPFFFLGVLILVQFAVPFSMIQSREAILRDGELFRFKTRPIDPADPFQGRYVRLVIAENYIPCPKNKLPELARKRPGYAIVETNSAGFAHFTQWSTVKPDSGAYLKTRYMGPYSIWNQATTNSIYKGIALKIPFERYYMDEAKAPQAERLTWGESNTNCWVCVRILNGKAAIEDVFAQGKSLRDLVAEE